MKKRGATILTRSEESADRILQMILNSKYRPGQSLSQRVIARLLNVSPIVAREAFRILEREGVVEIRPNSGCRVVDFSLDKIKGHYLVREVLEGLAARLTSERIQKEQTERLYSLADQVDRFFNNPESDYRKLALIHYRFHTAIISLSGCREIAVSLKQINIQDLIFFTSRIVNLNRLRPASPSWHRDLVDRIAGGNPGEAEAMMKLHVRKGLDDILLSLRKDEAEREFICSEISVNKSDFLP